MNKGPIQELPDDFSVLKFAPTKSRTMWTYVTCGMFIYSDFAPEQNDDLIELFEYK